MATRYQDYPHPLQSKAWAEFRRAWGNEIWETKFGNLTIHKIPYTKFKIGMFIKGPTPTKEMLEWFKVESKKRNIIFIKLEPNTTDNLKLNPFDKLRIDAERGRSIKTQNSKLQVKSKNVLINLLQKYGCVPGKTLFTPTTFWIDLTKNEEELMKDFTSKTRYNIRLAQKHGVKVVEDDSDKAFEKYLELMRETVNRQSFYAHSEKYHRLMWQFLHQSLITNNQSPIAHLLTAIYKDQIITSWVVFFYGDFLY